MKNAIKLTTFTLILIVCLFTLSNYWFYGSAKAENMKLKSKPEFIPNDVVSWKDEPDFEGLDLSQYDTYKEFYYSQKYSQIFGDRNILQSGVEADDHDTSLYMIGNVSVSVILPESNASSNNSENWTSEEIAQVHSEVENALDWWEARAAESNAPLNFIVNYEDQVEIEQEPIEEKGVFGSWRTYTMMSLGYPYEGDSLELFYDYVNDKMDEKNTDWGFIIFVVDSSNDEDGKFADDKFAFATLDSSGGGPYLVMTYDNGNYGINRMEDVSAHEIGHIFGAGDQYASSPCGCEDTIGYLDYGTQNCDKGCLINEPSIMKYIHEYVYDEGHIDEYARGQIGWVDENENGILDIIDFEPEINNSFNGVQQENFVVEGSSSAGGMNAINPYYANLIINEIGDVEYSVNNGQWNSGFALDGIFNEIVEAYGISSDVSNWGEYLFKIRAKDRFGYLTSEENYLEFNYSSVGCTDTDEDDDIKVKGLVENYNGTYNSSEDTCNNGILRQYSCSGDDIVHEDFNCLYGCKDGVCLDKPNFLPKQIMKEFSRF